MSADMERTFQFDPENIFEPATTGFSNCFPFTEILRKALSWGVNILFTLILNESKKGFPDSPIVIGSDVWPSATDFDCMEVGPCEEAGDTKNIGDKLLS